MILKETHDTTGLRIENMIICFEHLFNKENLMLMKNLFPSRVIVCVITLLTLTFPVFAQNHECDR